MGRVIASLLRPDRHSAPPLILCLFLTLLAFNGRWLPPITLASLQSDYAGVHMLLEMIAIAISAMVFGLGWSLRRQPDNILSVIVGAGFLAVAIIDTFHALSYLGMPVLVTPATPEKAINFWLTGRGLTALALLSVGLTRRGNLSPLVSDAVFLLAGGIVGLSGWIGFYHADWLPRTFIPGQGLTEVKIGTEYVLMAMLALATFGILWRQDQDHRYSHLWLAAGAWTLALAESFFTLYASVSDLFNLLGHLYKAAAYLMIYKALFAKGVSAPYAELARERARLRSLLTSIPDLIWMKAPDGRYLACNPAFEEFFGAREAEIINKTDYDFVPQDLADFFRRKDKEAISAHGPSINDEWVTFANDGHRALLETLKTPVYTRHGELLGVLGIARDITARVQAERSLEVANQNLEQFAYVASHDLREPLRTISSYVTLLERRYSDKLDDEGREFIGYVRDGAKRLNGMVLELLEFSRIGRAPDAGEAVVLDQVIADALAGLTLAIKESRAEITLDGPFPTIRGSRSEMLRLFQNLIGNALKYHRPDQAPAVTIRCRRQKDDWLCTVEDNGIGIDPQYFDRIFGIFQRLHTRDKFGGNGIGLAICKKIVEHHGGKIWVESQPGQGCRFQVSLPAED